MCRAFQVTRLALACEVILPGNSIADLTNQEAFEHPFEPSNEPNQNAEMAVAALYAFLMRYGHHLII
jgi:hypothetical protein